MNNRRFSKILAGIITSLVLLFMVGTSALAAEGETTPISVDTHGIQSLAVQNLSFQADIFGDSTPENIEYVADLNYYDWGGYGINAHVFRALLQSGDQIAYGISDNDPNAFTFDLSPKNSSTHTTLTITKAEYSAGTVTMPSANQLNFVWEINKSGFHFKLNKIAILDYNPNLTAKYVVYETFSIENLGSDFDLYLFSEYYHMDDIARLRDYDNNGVNETLLAINNYSTSGYPVFGKVYLSHQNMNVVLVSDGVYATVNHIPVNKAFSSGMTQEIVLAAYITGLAKNSSAENQVAADAQTLLNENTPLLSLPFPHKPGDNGLSHIYSYFDHEYPIMGVEPSTTAGSIVKFTGERVPEAANCQTNDSCYSGHNGIDFSKDGINSSTAVLAAMSGMAQGYTEVCPTDKNKALINVISVTEGRYKTVYLHVQGDSYWQDLVANPHNINQGDRIGTIGESGGACATGYHLHFGVYYDQNNDRSFEPDEVVDPYGWRNQCSQVTSDPWTIIFTDINGAQHTGATSGWLWNFAPPVCTAISAGAGQTLSASDGVTVTFPVGALTNPATIAYNIAPEPGGGSASITNHQNTPASANETTIATGHTFQITAISLDGTAVTSFALPVNVTLTYTDSDLAYSDESTLKLYRWDETGANWIQLTTTLDTASKQAAANIDQPGVFSLRAQPFNQTPSIIGVSPSEANNSADLDITITGTNFLPTPAINLGIGGLAVNFVSSSLLTATIPAGMVPGIYDLALRNPDGQIAILPNAFTIQGSINNLLDVTKNGTGSGTVTSDPAGIDCGSTCSYSYDYGTEVTLTAFTTPPNTFAGWSGGGCSGTDTCTVTLDSDQSVTASFSNVPILVSPDNGVTLPNKLPTLDWLDVPGATRYDIQVARNSTFKSGLKTYNAYSSAYTASKDWIANATYYWRVRAYGSFGVTGFSDARSFTTGNPTSIPALLLPKKNALTTNYKPRLDWKNCNVPTGTTFQKYELELATDSAFTSAVSVDITEPSFNPISEPDPDLDAVTDDWEYMPETGLYINTTISEYTPDTDLDPNTTYYWRVRAYNTLDQYSDWSKVSYFRTAILPPTLSSPDNGFSTTNRRPVFDWSNVDGASGYILQVSTSSAFKSSVIKVTVTSSTYTPGKDLPVGTLYWRVMAKGVNGPSLWSDVWTLIEN